MARARDLAALVVALFAAATAVALIVGGPAGDLLLALAGLSLPALLLLAGGPERPRWLGLVHAALAIDLFGTGLLLLALRSRGAEGIEAGPPVALVVQLVGLWLVPFLLTATAALVAGRRR